MLHLKIQFLVTLKHAQRNTNKFALRVRDILLKKREGNHKVRTWKRGDKQVLG